MSVRVIVIGAGLGGLAAACHLVDEHDVLVLERSDVPGGRAGTRSLGGYRFDTGPTVLTMPGLIDDCIRAAGSEPADLLTLHPVDPMYRAVYADGSVLHVRHGRDAMAEEIRSVCGAREAEAFHRFCRWLTELYALELPNFIDRNFDSPFDLARPLGPALQLLRLGAFRKLAAVVESYFDDPRLHRMFSFQSMYAGLAPHEALAIYCVITYMDSVAGVYFPEGGMHAVPAAMATAATKAGAEFRYGAAVERILLEHGSSGRVRGVRMTDGESIDADVVVCNADLPVAYRTLLGGMEAPRVARKGRYSPSCVVWHAGVRGRPDPSSGIAHHNIHFGSEWDASFHALLRDGIRMPDPSTLVTVPSLAEPSMAPDGSSVLYVLEPVPNLDGVVDWTVERGRIRDELAARVEGFGYPVEVEVDELVDPLDWEAQGMERGTPFGLSHHFFQTGPFRPDNVDRRAPGLVFVGSSTRPGVGVPMVLLSGRLAAERVRYIVDPAYRPGRR
jgi:phytoene desaturase